ncbi:unnamed protein product [Eruca vesicaria subsp. sativa]|uniref:MADS-box domain-containing protein n=1 Tax=Eruca vesicaria subsp. sativa TaxID=29727 RepID=A0ABC8J6K9_ERUVS|nr:unnamed protein product [Eruca vesicaria subsp. sativa]
MARNRAKMTFLENNTSRKATFRKRKEGLMKKASELSILCGVAVAVIIEGEYSSVPEVFPREDVGSVIDKWDKLSQADKDKKMVNHEKYLKQRIEKAKEKLNKVNKENREMEMKELMFDCLRNKTAPCFLGPNELRDLGVFIDQYIKILSRRIETLTNNQGSSSTSVVPAAAGTTSVAMPTAAMGSSSTGFNNMIEENMNEIPNVKDFDLNRCSEE